LAKGINSEELGVGLRPITCWDCGFESRRGHGCLLWVVCIVR